MRRRWASCGAEAHVGEREARAEGKSHETILESAARLVRERGISGARVADVMKGAGLTVGGFYAHFASKEDLVDEVLRRTGAELRERSSRGIEEKPEADRAEVVLKRYLSAAHRDDAEPGVSVPGGGRRGGHDGRRARARARRAGREGARFARGAPPRRPRRAATRARPRPRRADGRRIEPGASGPRDRALGRNHPRVPGRRPPRRADRVQRGDGQAATGSDHTVRRYAYHPSLMDAPLLPLCRCVRPARALLRIIERVGLTGAAGARRDEADGSACRRHSCTARGRTAPARCHGCCSANLDAARPRTRHRRSSSTAATATRYDGR